MVPLTLCTRKLHYRWPYNVESNFISLRSKWQVLPRNPWAVPKGWFACNQAGPLHRSLPAIWNGTDFLTWYIQPWQIQWISKLSKGGWYQCTGNSLQKQSGCFNHRVVTLVAVSLRTVVMTLVVQTNCGMRLMQWLCKQLIPSLRCIVIVFVIWACMKVPYWKCRFVSPPHRCSWGLLVYCFCKMNWIRLIMGDYKHWTWDLRTQGTEDRGPKIPESWGLCCTVAVKIPVHYTGYQCQWTIPLTNRTTA